MRVLLADSSATTRRRLERVLRAGGHESSGAAGAAQALTMCRRLRPDVLVISAALIERDGIPVIDLVKADPDVYGISVVQTVAQEPSLDEAQATLRRGTVDYLIEPVRPAELLARVRSAGRLKQLQEELVEQTRRLERQLFTDPLTRVYNRRFVLGQLEALVSAARRHQRPLAAAMIDLDAFKAVNDGHGHATGDAVLVASAQAIEAELRAEDVLGRMGGEEFLVVLPDADETAAARAAERLRCAVAEAGGPVPVTASIGWAVRADGERSEELLRRADEALYEAKAAGRDAVRGASEPSAASLRRRS